jgi:hypothetical protein
MWFDDPRLSDPAPLYGPPAPLCASMIGHNPFYQPIVASEPDYIWGFPNLPLGNTTHAGRYTSRTSTSDAEIAHQVSQQGHHTDSTSESEDSSDDMDTRSSVIYRVTDNQSEHWIDVFVNGVCLRAFPDSGSACNLVSETYARDNNFIIKDYAKKVFRLPNGNIVNSLGEVEVMFRFADEMKALYVTFKVLASCIHDFVLSGPFLWATQTFTKLKDRIYSLPICRPAVRVCFHGTSHQQMIGSLNGYPVTAIVDTGADVNVITESYAISLGLEMSPDNEATDLVFIDGSSVVVRGIVRDAACRCG